MPAKNNTNLGLAACFQTNTLFRNRHIRVYYAVCAPRLSLKTRRKTCSREEPLINSIFRRALRLILRSFHGLYLYTNPRKRLALIARRA